ELIRPISIQDIQLNALRPLDMSLSTFKILPGNNYGFIT
ncbi:SDR family NAD(P)-dependent oxidoreductase, partial [Leptospira santarosai]|nr:SDR family NAD(P)-dependent oxidoreductase [Leptospira santarosai]